MKAVYIEEHGGPEQIRVGELPTPGLENGQVLVRLQVAALNHLDLWVREGWAGLELNMPHILGADGAGEVAELGADVQDLEIGQPVVINSNLSCGRCAACQAGWQNRCRDWGLLGETTPGTFAQFIALPAQNLLPLPAGFDYKLAAAAGLVYQTAWHSLITLGRLQPGEDVLVVGASGGVNSASIQIARLAGARVIAVGSNREKLALAEALGAQVLIDRSKDENWSKAVYKATNKRGVDVVVDNVGAASMGHSLRAARRGGRILIVGNTSGPRYEIDQRYLFAKHLSLIGSTMGTHRDFKTVIDLVLQGRLQPALDRSFSLDQAPQALNRLESGEQLGKITLDMV